MLCLTILYTQILWFIIIFPGFFSMIWSYLGALQHYNSEFSSATCRFLQVSTSYLRHLRLEYETVVESACFLSYLGVFSHGTNIRTKHFFGQGKNWWARASWRNTSKDGQRSPLDLQSDCWFQKWGGPQGPKLSSKWFVIINRKTHMVFLVPIFYRKLTVAPICSRLGFDWK